MAICFRHLQSVRKFKDECQKQKYIMLDLYLVLNQKFSDKRCLAYLTPYKGFQRGFSVTSIIRNIILPFRIVKSLIKTNKILKEFEPEVVIGTGGYASAIPLYMVSKKMIPQLSYFKSKIRFQESQLGYLRTKQIRYVSHLKNLIMLLVIILSLLVIQLEKVLEMVTKEMDYMNSGLRRKIKQFSYLAVVKAQHI